MVSYRFYRRVEVPFPRRSSTLYGVLSALKEDWRHISLKEVVFYMMSCLLYRRVEALFLQRGSTVYGVLAAV